MVFHEWWQAITKLADECYWTYMINISILRNLKRRRKVFSEIITNYQPMENTPPKEIDPRKMQEIICGDISQAVDKRIFPFLYNPQCDVIGHGAFGFFGYQSGGSIPMTNINNIGLFHGVHLGGARAVTPRQAPTFEAMLFSGKSNEDIKNEVIKALENKNYDWRSIDGIARETHLPREEVEDMIRQLAKEGIVVRAPYCDKKGNRIYTTRKHYHETVGFIGRFISAITNRIV